MFESHRPTEQQNNNTGRNGEQKITEKEIKSGDIQLSRQI